MKYTIVVNLAVDDNGTLQRVPKKLQLRATAKGAQEAVQVADGLLSLAIAEGAPGAGAQLSSARGTIYDICHCRGVTNPPEQSDKGYAAWCGLLLADHSSRKALLKRSPRSAAAAREVPFAPDLHLWRLPAPKTGS